MIVGLFRLVPTWQRVVGSSSSSGRSQSLGSAWARNAACPIVHNFTVAADEVSAQSEVFSLSGGNV